MSTTRAVRVLPADVYDALELSAEAFGGIGAGDLGLTTLHTGGVLGVSRYDLSHGRGDPCCLLGHAAWLDGPGFWEGTVRMAIARAGISWSDNDRAVWVINARKCIANVNANDRVSFAEWCAEMGVVRGDK